MRASTFVICAVLAACLVVDVTQAGRGRHRRHGRNHWRRRRPNPCPRSVCPSGYSLTLVTPGNKFNNVCATYTCTAKATQIKYIPLLSATLGNLTNSNVSGTAELAVAEGSVEIAVEIANGDQAINYTCFASIQSCSEDPEAYESDCGTKVEVTVEASGTGHNGTATPMTFVPDLASVTCVNDSDTAVLCGDLAASTKDPLVLS
eukprot:m.19893 g.19893  ORF g.19893 m.19893 type:complete len:204 (-) comp6036_c0_seq1:124-735(-)